MWTHVSNDLGQFLVGGQCPTFWPIEKEIVEMLSYCLWFLVSKTICFLRSQVTWERLLTCSKSKLTLDFSEWIEREMFVVPLTGRNRVVNTRVSTLGRNQDNLSVKDQLVNILGSAGHTVPATATGLCRCKMVKYGAYQRRGPVF